VLFFYNGGKLNNYINYHCHTQFSNIITPDSTLSNSDRVNRVLELGQTVVSSVEHGWAGRFIETIELAKKNNLKPLIGAELYFVKNRKASDKTNSHLILLAKNEIGRKQINSIISEANVSGYYYKPRVDLELLAGVATGNIWVTTACIGGIWKYEDSEDILKTLKEYFGQDLFLEVQNHPVWQQVELNKNIVSLSKRYDIRMIAGMDSHVINNSQLPERENYLLSRGIEYPDEQGWNIDFPSYDIAFERFVAQGVLNENQVRDALYNTLRFEDVQEYNSPIFDNGTIKLPTLYPNKSQADKDSILEALVWDEWEKEKSNVDEEMHNFYKSEIKKELETVQKTGMADYFLLNYKIIKLGKSKGGKITLTGRGSAPSFYITKLLGFTTVDRIAASVKLFPERFISVERILETKSLPDIDFNLANPEVFANAQTEIMGEGHSYQMIAFGTVKTLGAWKIYARVAGVDFETANVISGKLKQYEHDLSKMESEEEREFTDVASYIGKKYVPLYEESLKYLGIVNSLTSHPCASLLYSDGDLREEFGLIKIKTGSVEHLCVACDGLQAETYKFLKNDLLKVSVVDLIYGVYEKIGREPHTLPELIDVCDGDKDVWQIYQNAWTMGINQVEQHGSSSRVATYKPQNLSELSAFVAAIRPGFKSYYKQFEAREPFSYDVPTLDKLIQTKEFPYSYMLYQENAMQVMAFASIYISITYDVLKNIAKKRADKVFKVKARFLEGMKARLIDAERISEEEAIRIANNTWQVIEDSSKYSFNASHSYCVAGDSLYGAYLKSKYPLEFYETFLTLLESDGDKDRLASARTEAEKAFKIKFPNFKFRQDNRRIVSDKKTNSITSSMKTIKGFGDLTGERMYELGNIFEKGDFIDLLIFAEEKGYLSKKWEQLIKIDYFSEFGKNKKLLMMYQEFTGGKSRYNSKLTDKSKDKRIPELREIFTNLPDVSFQLHEQIQNDIEIFGTIHTTFNVDSRYAYIQTIDERFAPRMEVYSLAKGTVTSLKVQKKYFENNVVSGGEIIYCEKFEKKPTVKMVDGNFVEVKGEDTWWLRAYRVVENFDEIKDTRCQV